MERMARFREEMTRTTGAGPTLGFTGADPTPTPPWEDSRVGRRARSIEGTRGRDGGRARVGSEKTVTVSVSAFPGFGGWSRRATCWPTPGCAHGDSDQLGEHSGPVEPIQPVSVTKESRMSARYGLRGVRVGEAKNPGPVIERGESPVRVQTQDQQWERPSTMI